MRLCPTCDTCFLSFYSFSIGGRWVIFPSDETFFIVSDSLFHHYYMAYCHVKASATVLRKVTTPLEKDGRVMDFGIARSHVARRAQADQAQPFGDDGTQDADEGDAREGEDGIVVEDASRAVLLAS